jgi:DNA-binding MarR family transcriptional regulator
MSSAQPVSDLTAHIGFWLRMVSNHVSHAFAAKLADKEVTVAEWSLMRVLYGKEPMPPSRLADEMGMSRGAITKLADRLIAKSLVTREASAEDGRAQTLALTDRGRVLVPDLAALADRNDAEFFDCLAAAERETLGNLLKSLAQRGHMTATPIE